MNKIWKYIKAEQLFKDYLPFINNHRHKIRGFNGRGNPIEFTSVEKKQIKEALKKMLKDLLNEK